MNKATFDSNSPSPICSKCGYPTRGISELICPECGADLRIVGTVMSGKRGRMVKGCLMPILFTILVAVFSLALYMYLGRNVLTVYNDHNITLQFQPESKQYDEIKLWMDATSTTRAGQGNSQGSINSLTDNSTTPSTTSLSLFNSGTQFDVDSMTLAFSPDPSSPTAIYDWGFNIDPVTHQADWIDAKTKVNIKTPGPFTAQDILARLANLDVDTTNPDVISEANELHKLIDGMLNGKTQFTLRGLYARSYGSGYISRPGPTWVLITYWIVWSVIWIIGLIILARHARKKV